MPDCHETQAQEPLEVLIIGAGFAGLCMAIQLKAAGIERFEVLEKGAEIGGTWRDNVYPGCACDVQSHLYSYSFEANPDWSRLFATQPEILAYLQHCVDKYGLRPFIRLGRRVLGAVWDDDRWLWTVTTGDGEVRRARAVVSAMGALHTPAIPPIPGLDRFAGRRFHSARWDHSHALAGRRVAVVGTGASAIQFVPRIAPQLASLTLFQRTPPWILPKPDRAISEAARYLFRRFPSLQHLRRCAIYLQLETRVLGLAMTPKLMRLRQWLARAHLHRQIKDRALRRKLTPDYTIGCKRILLSNDYYPTLARDKVTLVTEGIREVVAEGIVDSAGRFHAVDTIIFGTGFRVQGRMPRGTIVGPAGFDLADAWARGPEAYLGMSVAGLPNFFFLLGPNSGLGHSSMIFMIESQVRYLVDALQRMRRQGLRRIEVRPDVQARFNRELEARAARAVWASGCRSWYLDDRGRNTTLWPGFTFDFRLRARRFVPERYWCQF